MSEPKIRKVKLSEIKPDLLNANKHTERGHIMLRNSMSEFGFAEAGTLDKEGRVIGGNHRLEVAGDLLESDEAIVIEVDGKSPVFIKRDDIDLTTPEGRRLAYTLNRSAQISIEFDPEQVATDLAEGINLDGLFYENEIANLFSDLELSLDIDEGGNDDNNIPHATRPNLELPANPELTELPTKENNDNSSVSHVVMVQLFLNTETEPYFREWVDYFKKYFDVNNTTDAIWEACKYARNTLKRE